MPPYPIGFQRLFVDAERLTYLLAVQSVIGRFRLEFAFGLLHIGCQHLYLL